MVKPLFSIEVDDAFIDTGHESCKVIMENVPFFDVDEEEIIGELHLKTTYQGMVIDFVVDGQVYKSAWMTIDDLLEKVH